MTLDVYHIRRSILVGRRSQKIGGGAPIKKSRRRRQQIVVGGGAALLAHGSS